MGPALEITGFSLHQGALAAAGLAIARAASEDPKQNQSQPEPPSKSKNQNLNPVPGRYTRAAALLSHTSAILGSFNYMANIAQAHVYPS